MLKLNYSHYMESESPFFWDYYSVIAEKLYAGLISEPDLDQEPVDMADEMVPARQHTVVQRQKPNREHRRRYEASHSEERPARQRISHSRELIST